MGWLNSLIPFHRFLPPNKYLSVFKNNLEKYEFSSSVWQTQAKGILYLDMFDEKMREIHLLLPSVVAFVSANTFSSEKRRHQARQLLQPLHTYKWCMHVIYYQQLNNNTGTTEGFYYLRCFSSSE